jgi:hypothetical protein
MLDITSLFNLKYEVDLLNDTITLFQEDDEKTYKNIIKVKPMSFNDFLSIRNPSVLLNEFGYSIEISDCPCKHHKCSVVELVNKTSGAQVTHYHYKFIDLQNPMISDKRNKENEMKLNCILK